MHKADARSCLFIVIMDPQAFFAKTGLLVPASWTNSKLGNYILLTYISAGPALSLLPRLCCMQQTSCGARSQASPHRNSCTLSRHLGPYNCGSRPAGSVQADSPAPGRSRGEVQKVTPVRKHTMPEGGEGWSDIGPAWGHRELKSAHGGVAPALKGVYRHCPLSPVEPKARTGQDPCHPSLEYGHRPRLGINTSLFQRQLSPWKRA